MKAYVFPGQGSQFSGMGKELFDSNPKAKALFLKANEVLGFDITKIMFSGSDEELRQTNVTQPAIFIDSVITALCMEDFNPKMVAGHSLGEFSALAAVGSLSFADGLTLVSKRANAMQKACENSKGTMAAILGLEDEVVEKVCASISGIVVAANYNCPGQLVISGTIEGIEEACEKLKEAGAKRAIVLSVSGAFHSPLMDPAKKELEEAIKNTEFRAPSCPIFQNVNANSQSDPIRIQQNLIDQLTSPVRWTQSVQNMIAAGATSFTEVGPGNVLQGMVKKINREVETASA